MSSASRRNKQISVRCHLWPNFFRVAMRAVSTTFARSLIYIAHFSGSFFFRRYFLATVSRLVSVSKIFTHIFWYDISVNACCLQMVLPLRGRRGHRLVLNITSAIAALPNTLIWGQVVLLKEAASSRSIDGPYRIQVAMDSRNLNRGGLWKTTPRFWPCACLME